MVKYFTDEMIRIYTLFIYRNLRGIVKISDDKYLLVKSIVNGLSINFIDVHKGLFLNEKEL